MSLKILNDRKFRKITYPGVPSNRYMISEYGDIYSIISDKILKSDDNKGYYRVVLGNRHFSIHRLVAYQFLPETRDLSLVVDHLDCNTKNNYYKNLEWVTVKENTRRAIANGKRDGKKNGRGEFCTTNVYSEDFIHDICGLLEDGKRPIDVFRIVQDDAKHVRSNGDFALYQLIWKLKKKSIWPDVVSQYSYNTEDDSTDKLFTVDSISNSRFTEKQIHQICKLHVEGKSTKEILLILGIDESNPEYKQYGDRLRDITSGKSWKYISEQYFIKNKIHRTNQSHNIDTELVYMMLDKGYTKNQILRMYGVKRSCQDPKLSKAIDARIERYRKLARSPGTSDIYLDDIVINVWAAIQ